MICGGISQAIFLARLVCSSEHLLVFSKQLLGFLSNCLYLSEQLLESSCSVTFSPVVVSCFLSNLGPTNGSTKAVV